jgi:ribosomal protein S18 acetylase RimI-like enzyme
LLDGVEVRDARPEELAPVGDLRVAAYRADGFLSEESRYAARLHSLGADGTGDVLVAVEDGHLLGTVMLMPWPHGNLVRAPDEAEIRALAVSREARRGGIGRALVAAVTHRAAERGVRHLLLLTMPEMRAAHRLYAEAGFSRLPDRDAAPGGGPTLLAFGMKLSGG